jgi:uncharacterized membrane protein YbhN (UPF0104 family)
MQPVPRPLSPALLRGVRAAVGLVVLAVAVGYLVAVGDWSAVGRAAGGVAAEPLAVGGALVGYAAAFGLRTAAWCHVLPQLPAGQSWAALHVSLLGNHVLPFRLGEVLRVTSVLRRTQLPVAPVVASTVALRATDLLAVVVLAVVAAPTVLNDMIATRWAVLLATVVLAGVIAGSLWLRRLPGSRLPGVAVIAAAVGAWLLESLVVLSVAQAAGISLSFPEAVGVTAVTIVAQAVAVTPGGIGSYEAAGTAALAALGVPVGDALAVVLLTHALKTAYALVVGAVALLLPAPGYWGRWRLSRQLPPRPLAESSGSQAPVVAFLPAHNEEQVVADVVRRLPAEVDGRRVQVLVIDDGSTDGTAGRAEAAGAHVVRLGANRGLGAAVRRGLAESLTFDPACVVYLDADGEYAPEDLALVASPVLSGAADYVVGSRFAGRIDVMQPHRRLGNVVLTTWVRWMTRRRDLTDGQSGYRAFSPSAARAAEVVHDYNYAQVLTLDLLAKGFVYAETPIRYSFRTSGTSFIRLHQYLRRVLPAVHAELNPRAPALAPAPVGEPAPVAGPLVLDDVAPEPLASR